MLHQYWGLFAPPPRNDGWDVFAASLADGSVQDVFPLLGVTDDAAYLLDYPLTSDKPADVGARMPNNRWHQYLRQLRRNLYARQPIYEVYSHFFDHVCRAWNSRQLDDARRIKKVTYIFVEEFTLDEGAPSTWPTHEQQMYTFQCFR